MKLIFYIDKMSLGGAQRVMKNLIDYYVGNGNEVVLINDACLPEDIPQYHFLKGVKREYLRETLKGNVLIKNLQRIYRLRRIIRRERADIAISFLGRPNVRLILASIGIKCKTIVSVRNDPWRECGASVIRKFFYRNLLCLASGCVFQLEEAKNFFPKSVKRKSTIIINPVSDAFFKAERSENPKGIIAVGRLEEQKNHKMLIEAFGKTSPSVKDETLTIWGEGKLRKELENLVEELDLQRYVFLPGECVQIEKEMEKARFIVLTSKYEGLPNVIMEAMAIGLPCIAFDCPCGGARFLLRNGKCGALVSNDEELKNTMEMLIEDENKSNLYSVEAKKVADSFRIEKIMMQWDIFIKDVINNFQAGRKIDEKF